MGRPGRMRVIPEAPVGRAVPVQDQALLREWQARGFKALEHLSKCKAEDGGNAQRWATVAGIATDKVLVLAGRPTAIVAGIHEVRYTLPQLTERLLRVAGSLPAKAETA